LLGSVVAHSQLLAVAVSFALSLTTPVGTHWQSIRIHFPFFFYFLVNRPSSKSPYFLFPVLGMLTAFQFLPGKKSKSSAITYTITCEGSVTSDYLEPQFSRFVR
jgi:hypothetical protein